MPKLSKIKIWSSSLLWVLITYVLATDFLVNLLLVVVNSSGYLPYSDRPGPGWQRPHLPSKEELQFFLSFALFLLRGTALYGGLFAALARAFGVLPHSSMGSSAHRYAFAFFASGIMMAAAGWI